MHHHHGHEQAVRARNRFDGANSGDRAVEVLPAGDKTDGAGPVGCQCTSGVAGTIVKLFNGALHLGACGR